MQKMLLDCHIKQYTHNTRISIWMLYLKGLKNACSMCICNEVITQLSQLFLLTLIILCYLQSTYCSTIQKHCNACKRTAKVFNLDPAAENFDYDVYGGECCI